MKIIIKYLMMYLSLVLGVVLFSLGITNLLSSLLLFVGGYLSVKNTLDYRLVKRNINKLKESNIIGVNKKVLDSDIYRKEVFLDNISNLENKKNSSLINPINHNVDDIVGIKRVRRYGRVRRRY